VRLATGSVYYPLTPGYLILAESLDTVTLIPARITECAMSKVTVSGALVQRATVAVLPVTLIMKTSRMLYNTTNSSNQQTQTTQSRTMRLQSTIMSQHQFLVGQHKEY